MEAKKAVLICVTWIQESVTPWVVVSYRWSGSLGFKLWKSVCGMSTFGHEAWPDSIPLISDRRSLIHSPERILPKFSWIILPHSVLCSFFLCPFLWNIFLLCCPLKTPKILGYHFTLQEQPNTPCHDQHLHWDTSFIIILLSTSSVSSPLGSLYLHSSHTLILVNTFGSFIHPPNIFFALPNWNFIAVRASLKSGSTAEQQWMNGEKDWYPDCLIATLNTFIILLNVFKEILGTAWQCFP